MEKSRRIADELKGDVRRLEVKVTELSAENRVVVEEAEEARKAAESRADSLSDETQRLKEELRLAHVALKDVEAKEARATSETEAVKADLLAAEMALKAEEDKGETATADLRRQLESLRRELDRERDEKSEEKARMEGEMESALREKEGWVSGDEHEAVKEKLEASVTERRSLSSALEELRRDIRRREESDKLVEASLKEELETARLDRDEFNTKIEVLDESNKTLKREKEDAEKNAAKLVEQMRAAEKSSREALANAQSETEKAKSREEDLEKKLAAEKLRNEALGETLRRKQGKMDSVARLMVNSDSSTPSKHLLGASENPGIIDQPALDDDDDDARENGGENQAFSIDVPIKRKTSDEPTGQSPLKKTNSSAALPFGDVSNAST